MLSSCRIRGLLAASGCVDDPEVQIVWGVCDVRGGAVDGDLTLGNCCEDVVGEGREGSLQLAMFLNGERAIRTTGQLCVSRYDDVRYQDSQEAPRGVKKRATERREGAGWEEGVMKSRERGSRLVYPRALLVACASGMTVTVIQTRTHSGTTGEGGDGRAVCGLNVMEDKSKGGNKKSVVTKPNERWL